MSDTNTYVALDKQTKEKVLAYGFHGVPASGDFVDTKEGDYKIIQVGGRWIDGYPVIRVEKA